jgi:hypothetical protein
MKKIIQGSSAVEQSAVNRLAVGSIPTLGAKTSRGGETGRRTGLKILRYLYYRIGSIPIPGTKATPNNAE